MKSYRCDTLLTGRDADGYIRAAEASDIELLVEFLTDFHIEINSDIEGKEEYRRKIEQLISDKSLFLWVDSAGNRVACCSYTDYDNYSSVGMVYTPPQFRRKGYAYAIVSTVTKIIMERNRVPVLYTDADYIASNACYTKIGYELMGELCTIR